MIRTARDKPADKHAAHSGPRSQQQCRIGTGVSVAIVGDLRASLTRPWPRRRARVECALPPLAFSAGPWAVIRSAGSRPTRPTCPSLPLHSCDSDANTAPRSAAAESMHESLLHSGGPRATSCLDGYQRSKGRKSHDTWGCLEMGSDKRSPVPCVDSAKLSISATVGGGCDRGLS